MELELVNFEDFGLVELNTQEIQEIEGGIIPLIIAVFLCWGTQAAY
ncbi:class IIb bacteriocin, lactobin A/cerein 7B family [Flavobacterium denitrificans]|nr:class IIb bacteriocin, lactobin A/cerein 7B family [Flavobacterium denitrificans]